MKYTKTQIDESLAYLRANLKPGDTVHTILRHVSRSGMSREISVVMAGPHDIDWHVSRVLGLRIGKRNGLVVGGCGMNMGFHVVYSLSRTLWPDGFGMVPQGNTAGQRPETEADAKRWVSQGQKFRGRNGDDCGWDNDGGYALKHRWL